MRRRPAAQQGALAGSSHRREVARLDARRLVADPIDAAVDQKQRTKGEPVVDLVPRDPGLEELRAGHNSVRPGRKASDFSICPAPDRHQRS
jgi:hypothetical protein